MDASPASVVFSGYENIAAWWDQSNPIDDDPSRSDTQGASRGVESTSRSLDGIKVNNISDPRNRRTGVARDLGWTHTVC
jgi:hypothetical protein